MISEQTQRGATLIEVLAAVAILAILAGLATIAASGFIRRAKVQVCRSQIALPDLARTLGEPDQD